MLPRTRQFSNQPAEVSQGSGISGFNAQYRARQAEQDVFPGCLELKDGYFHAKDKPGFGIDMDEKLAAKFPVTDHSPFDYHPFTNGAILPGSISAGPQHSPCCRYVTSKVMPG